MTVESFRNTTLCRTSLHEVGHYVDWQRSVLDVDWQRSVLDVHGETEEEDEAIARAFETKTPTMKEDFAHRYAHEASSRLPALGQIPFDTQWNEAGMATGGIERGWFV